MQDEPGFFDAVLVNSDLDSTYTQLKGALPTRWWPAPPLTCSVRRLHPSQSGPPLGEDGHGRMLLGSWAAAALPLRSYCAWKFATVRTRSYAALALVFRPPPYGTTTMRIASTSASRVVADTDAAVPASYRRAAAAYSFHWSRRAASF